MRKKFETIKKSGDCPSVDVIDENGLPELRYIKVQGQSGHNWIVSDGLKSGDKVITGGIQQVIPGMPVKITKEDTKSNEIKKD